MWKFLNSSRLAPSHCIVWNTMKCRETFRRVVKYVTVWIRKCGPLQRKTFLQTSLREWSRRYCLFGFAWISLSKNGKYNLRLPAAILPKIQLLFVSLRLSIWWSVEKRGGEGWGTLGFAWSKLGLKSSSYRSDKVRESERVSSRVTVKTSECACECVSERASHWGSEWE